MNAILQIVSSDASASAVPAANLGAQPGSGLRGGFASTFAAAKNLSTSSSSSEEPAAAEVVVSTAAATTANLNLRGVAAGNSSPKKLPASGAGPDGAANVVVPAPSLPAANQILAEGSQAGVSQADNSPESTPPPSVPGQGLTPSAIPGTGSFDVRVLQASSPESGSAVTLAAPALGSRTSGAGPSSSTPNQANPQASAFASGQSPSSIAAPAAGSASSTLLPSIVLPSSVLANSAPGMLANSSEDGLQSSTLLAGNTAPAVPGTSTATFNLAEPSLSAANGVSATSSVQENGWLLKQTATAAPQPADTTTLADAGPQNDLAALSQASSADTIAPAGAAANDIAAQAAGTGLSPEIISALAASQQAAAPKILSAGAAPAIHAAARPAATPAAAISASTSTASTSAAGSESLAGDQTPFSVYFSSAGTESAASALPKMMLPATSSAVPSLHSVGTDTAGASPQSSGARISSAQNPNSTLQSGKDGQAGGSGSSLAGAPLHRNADGTPADGNPVSATPAGVPAASPSIAAAVVPGASPQPTVAPPSTAVSTTLLPLAAPAAPAPDSAPKSESTPGVGPGDSPSLVPPAPVPLVTGTVQMAQLMNGVGQSEMRIGLNTSAFGSVEVRAVVHANDVGLVIGSEKGDLRSLMGSEMPAISNTLQLQSMRLNSVNFMQGFAFSNNSSGGGNSQQHSFVPPSAPLDPALAGSAQEESSETLSMLELGGGGVGISILA